MQLNIKEIKKQQPPPPPFLYYPPPFQGYPPFLAKFLVPLPPKMTQFLEGPRGGGFPTKFLSSYL